MIKDGIDFLIAVEPQEYDLYKEFYDDKYLLKLPFQDLGLGSYPARNYCWEHSIKNGHERHWCFDDNIYGIRRLHKGKRIPVNGTIGISIIEEFTDRYTNIGISGFEYMKFVTNTTKKPYSVNTHIYSAMLMNNSMPYRWRLKFNEDVDLCLQVLHNKLCTVSFKAFMIHKVSTVAKMKGGNQTELYKGNNPKQKLIKAKTLEDTWPQYAKTVIRYKRPHHYVDWRKHFKFKLKRRTDIDWEEIKKKKFDIKLTEVKEVQAETLKKLKNEYKEGRSEKNNK